MRVNILHKVGSLLRRGQKFYCLSYDWDDKAIVVHSTEDDFRQEVQMRKKHGMVKRAQCYYRQIIIGPRGEQYLVYLVSLGDFRKGKMVRGENPISEGLGICMFDYVYLFVEPIRQAERLMLARAELLDKAEDFFYRNLMLSTYQQFFGKQEPATQIQEFVMPDGSEGRQEKSVSC